MKKLLLLGNNSHVDELIKYAKERGVYTIVTDNLPLERSPFKAMADESWDISVLDIDILEAKCREVGVNAVLCGASEVCIKANKELCERLGFPFYANQKAWDITNDKAEFKKACEQCGIVVPKEMEMDINFRFEDLCGVKYPVVIKPADGCSSIGLHICDNEADLIAGYRDAFEKSEIKKVVVEEFVSGEQVGFIYSVINGEVNLCISGDDAAYSEDAGRRVFGASPSKYMNLYEAELKEKIEVLVKYLEIENGIFGIQTIFNGSDLVVIEMNYRLPGGKIPGEKYICDVMLDYALAENTNPTKVPWGNQMFSYAIWLKPGKIAEIKGIEVLQSRPKEFSVQLFRHEGEDIQANTGMRQVLGFIMFFVDKEHHEEYIDFINENVKVLDEFGNDIVCHYRFKNGYAVD